MKITPPGERETTIADAASSEGKSPAERMAMFLDLLAVVDAIWMHFTPEERRRRQEIADQLDPWPDPWWKNVRREEVERALRDDFIVSGQGARWGREKDPGERGVG